MQASERVSVSRQNERQADAVMREATSRQAVFLEQQRTYEASLARFAAARDRLRAINARLGVLEDIEMDGELLDLMYAQLTASVGRLVAEHANFT